VCVIDGLMVRIRKRKRKRKFIMFVNFFYVRNQNDGDYLVSDLTSVLPIVCVFVKAVTGYL